MAATFALTELYKRPGFIIRRCHQLALSVFAEECKDLSLTTSQYGTMYILMGQPGIDQITLAGLLGVDRSTAALVVSGLEKRSLLKRDVSDGDRRRRLLFLTKAGVALLGRAMPRARSARVRLLAALSDREKAQLLRLLGKLLDANNSEMRVPLKSTSE